MSEGFVALTARCDENRIAADDGLLGSFSGMGTKSALPQNGFGVLEVALNENLDFFGSDGEINNGHLAAKAMEGVIAGGNDAAGSVENELALGVLFEAGENFIEDGDFLGEVLCFALEVSRAVRPTHPGGNAVDAAISTRVEGRSEACFDLIVAAHGGASKSGKIFCPMGLARTGHADESETKRLIRIRPHGELESLRDTRQAKEYKRRWERDSRLRITERVPLPGQQPVLWNGLRPPRPSATFVKSFRM
jgi:hypothetical protein